MSQVIGPIIIFGQLSLSEEKIRDSIRVSRIIARANGNRVNDRRIHLITDDFVLARDGLLPDDQRLVRPIHAAQNTGLFWPFSGVLWVKPRDTDDVVKTLAHEMAHSLSSGHHPHTWRRAYALILPFWWRKFFPQHPDGLSMRYEMSHVVTRYTKHRMSLSRRVDEVHRHLIASERALTRWGHLL